jgi:hypothetical protein
MFKKLAAFFLLLSASAVVGQEPDATVQPDAELHALQQKWQAYTPGGWRVLSASNGALFGPRSDDAALVIERDDPALRITNEGMGEPVLNTNPRALLLLSRQGSGYRLVSRIDGFLPSEGDEDDRCLADPLIEGPGVKIGKGMLTIGLQYWYSCGSWYVNQNIYKFRPEKARLRLTGVESFSFSRAGGPGSRTSMNFLTGRKKHIENAADVGPQPEEGEDIDLPAPVTKWTRISRGPFYLDAMKRESCAEYEGAPVWCGF